MFLELAKFVRVNTLKTCMEDVVQHFQDIGFTLTDHAASILAEFATLLIL